MNNQIEVGTDKGFYIYNPQNNTWQHYNATNSDLPDNVITCIVRISSTYLLGTTQGLVLFDTLTGVQIIYDTTNSALPSNHINCISSIGNDGYWIGTKNGLAKYKDSTVIAIDTLYNPLPDKEVTAIMLRYADSQVLIGTRSGGLMIYNIETGDISWYSTHDGLPTDSITSLGFLVDCGYLVGTTNMGLLTLNHSLQFDRVDTSIDNRKFKRVYAIRSNYFSAYVATDSGLLIHGLLGTQDELIPSQGFALAGYFDGSVVRLTFELDYPEDYDVELFDIFGRTLYTQRMMASGHKQQTIELPAHNLNSGIYLARVRLSKEANVVKLIIQH
jgi:hypothetical protein